MKSLSFDKIKIGTKKKFTTIINYSDIDKFSKVSGDYNVIHLDKNKAKIKDFKDRVVHGAQIFSLFSKLICTELPGNNSLILYIDMKFKNPAYPNKEISITGTVIEKYVSVNSIMVELIARYKKGKIISAGTATIKLL